ncbi:MAG: hypothetical protein JO345_22505 [Streptosporangiaceae bacterium]|nr:hypothetical protein [Streptosporangiaceae bacterium]
METIIEPLRAIDWEDIDAVESLTRKALAALTENRQLIRESLLTMPDHPELLRLCEHYDILDKVVLYDDPSGVRVRLHVFLPGYFDRPHNHRWSYASTILRGQYRHYLFGDANLDGSIDPASLKALMIRVEQPGSTYALHHTMVHAVVAEPHTVSLVIRGPAVKDRFLVMDRKTGQSWWQYGASRESTSDAEQKQMSPGRLTELTRRLQEWDLF